MRVQGTVVRFSMVAATAVVAMAFAARLPVAEPTAEARPAQQGELACSWSNAGSSSSNLIGASSGYSMSANEMWLYGGYDDQAAANRQSTNRIEKVTMTGTAGSPRVSHGIVNKNALDLFGAACALRDKGDTDQTALYCIGGSQKPFDDGRGSTTVQRYLVKMDQWETNVAVDGSFAGRFGAAADYDPVHDVIWVTGGTNSCKFEDINAGQTCNATAVPTMYLSFDDAAGTVKWNSLGSSESIFFHTMSYDSTGKRMIIFGGTRNGKDGQSAIKQIDLSDPDVTKAAAKSLSTSGSGPGTFMHGAAYDSDMNTLVTYGGIQRNGFTDNEQTNNATHILDLGMATATWKNMNTSTPQDRVGSVMEYDTKQKAAILALGRRAFDGGTDPFAATAQRTTYALTCMREAAPTATEPRPTNTPGGPTEPPPPTGEVPTPVPTSPTARVCDDIRNKVPVAVINAAVTAPQSVQGWDQTCNPNLPPSPLNIKRSLLTLQNPGQNFHPLFNSVVWKCGCR